MLRDLRCAGADFCEEIAGAQESTFSLVYEGEPRSRVIWETDGFRLIADLSPLSVGHLLLLPVEHYLSFAQLIEERGVELAEVLESVGALYRATFGRLTVLEHGSSAAMKSSACISHAHWHLMPIDGNRVNSLIMADGLPPAALTDLKQLVPYGGAPYFLCGQQGKYYVYDGRRPMRSQYLRSIVGQVLGIPDPLFDYALVVRKELLRETVARTSGWRSILDGPR
ncbi:HIT domain-containing protein [Streptomyces lydicus]|uniref:HIT family protein n=1 Tax=Streptomyces lydicus TaxID=47763 RepID=UPI002E32B241|nr:HIT domain-containing protein [Streptomyces lydicus]